MVKGRDHGRVVAAFLSSPHQTFIRARRSSLPVRTVSGLYVALGQERPPKNAGQLKNAGLCGCVHIYIYLGENYHKPRALLALRQWHQRHRRQKNDKGAAGEPKTNDRERESDVKTNRSFTPADPSLSHHGLESHLPQAPGHTFSGHRESRGEDEIAEQRAEAEPHEGEGPAVADSTHTVGVLPVQVGLVNKEGGASLKQPPAHLVTSTCMCVCVCVCVFFGGLFGLVLTMDISRAAQIVTPRGRLAEYGQAHKTQQAPGTVAKTGGEIIMIYGAPLTQRTKHCRGEGEAPLTHA